MVFSCRARISARKNCSERRYSTFAPGLAWRMALPAANIRWVLPRPTPPYRNSGLYEVPGFSAPCSAAARASWLALPVTKFSNVRSVFSRERSYTMLAASAVTACAATVVAGGAGGAAACMGGAPPEGCGAGRCGWSGG
ncbi:hypothetical protein G6F54_014075 [Rhizopus delemar]|nr:hypothetical protein G6F54_014075 [Rhizopus delemar]